MGLTFMAGQSHAPRDPSGPSRRSVVTTGSTLLAGFGLNALFPATSVAAGGGDTLTAAAAPSGELAAYRPVEVSSTDYAATPGEFVVDRLASPGVRGSGWRAAAGDDPQWIS